jgi:uncharacterized membrane protein YadS
MAEASENIVTDIGKWEWSELWKKEDWWAIWLGFIILIAGMVVYFPYSGDMKEMLNKADATYGVRAERTTAIKTIAWYKLTDAKNKAEARKIPAGKWLANFTHKTHAWSNNPMDAFFMGKEKAEAKAAAAKVKYAEKKALEKTTFAAALVAETLAEAAGFNNEALNDKATKAISSWRDAKLFADKAKKKTKAKPYNQIGSLIGLGVFFCFFFGIPMIFMGVPFKKYALGFTFVYGMTLLAWFFSYQVTMKHYGIGYAAWAIFLGMLVSNTVGTPKWAAPAIQTEYYIKTGLVLLGAKVLFEKVVTIGTAGIFVAWVVTPTVWLITYWFGQKIIKMPSKRLNAVICSDMSVCGVSASIAAASAVRAKKEELTLAVGLSLIFTAVMMIVMPAIIKSTFPVDKQMILGGAWMGGTIDASGAVAAAGAFLGEKALYVAATIKMIQNVLIGVIAFFLALYFTTKVEAEETGAKVSAVEIWYRFPKFVIGFILASVVFSLIYTSYNADTGMLGRAMIDKGPIKGMSDLFRKWFFTMSFVSIGLATNFRELKEYFKGGKPLILYVFGQSLNLILTLIMAYIMFYVVFPELTATI